MARADPHLWRRDVLLGATVLTVAANAIVAGVVYQEYGAAFAGIWIATRSGLSIVSVAQPSLVGGLVGLPRATMDRRTVGMALGGSLITRLPVGLLAAALVALLAPSMVPAQASATGWALAAYSAAFLIATPAGAVARACQRGDLLLASAVLEVLAAAFACVAPSLLTLLAAQTMKELLKAGCSFSVATPALPSRGLFQLLFLRTVRQYARDITQVLAQTGDRAAMALAFGSTTAGSAGLGAMAASVYSIIASNLYLWALPNRLRGDRSQDKRIELEVSAMVSGNVLLTSAANGIGTNLLTEPMPETWRLGVSGFSFSAAGSTLVALLAWNATSGTRRAAPAFQCAAIGALLLGLVIAGRSEFVSPLALLPLFTSLATGWLLYSLRQGGSHRSLKLARTACVLLIMSAATRFGTILTASSTAAAVHDLTSVLLAVLVLVRTTRERIAV